MNYINYYLTAMLTPARSLVLPTLLSGLLSALPLPGPASAGDCGLDLKPTDDYQALTAKLKCLENRIKALEGGTLENGTLENGTLAQTGAQRDRARPPASKFTQEISEVRFEVDNCQQDEKVILCKMFMTSFGADAEVTFGPNSGVIDGAGSKYRFWNYMGFGEQDWDFLVPAIKRTFIADVRTGGKFRFTGDPEQKAESLAILQLEVTIKDRKQLLNMRNIPVQ